MTDPKRDPARRCMPVAEWPPADRAAWRAALQGGDILDEAGAAAHWRPDTCKKVSSSYGRFLTHLTRQDRLDRTAGPEHRVTPDVLREYIGELREQVAPVTLAQRITDLHEALRVMVPEGEFGFVRRAYRRLSAQARPIRDKRSKVVHPRRLLDLAFRIMAEAETGVISETSRACRYRDGLILALLASRALRRRNLSTIRIGHHLVRDERGYVLLFDGEETKNHQPLEVRLPSSLTSHVERYLERYRPTLLKGKADAALWISYLGRPMAHGAIYDKIRVITRREFGVEVNLHLFRDCQATFMALDDPEHVGVIPSILGHNDPHTAERFYNQAGTVEAARRYQQGIQGLRRRITADERQRRKG